MDGLMRMGNGNVYQWPGHMFSFPSIKWDADPHWFRTRMGRWLAIVNRESCGDKGSPHRNIPKCGI